MNRRSQFSMGIGVAALATLAVLLPIRSKANITINSKIDALPDGIRPLSADFPVQPLNLQIADHQNSQDILQDSQIYMSDIESMPPASAKQVLQDWLQKSLRENTDSLSMPNGDKISFHPSADGNLEIWREQYDPASPSDKNENQIIGRRFIWVFKLHGKDADGLAELLNDNTQNHIPYFDATRAPNLIVEVIGIDHAVMMRQFIWKKPEWNDESGQWQDNTELTVRFGYKGSSFAGKTEMLWADGRRIRWDENGNKILDLPNFEFRIRQNQK